MSSRGIDVPTPLFCPLCGAALVGHIRPREPITQGVFLWGVDCPEIDQEHIRGQWADVYNDSVYSVYVALGNQWAEAEWEKANAKTV